MKTQLILAVFLSFYASLALGQTLDCQWLMIDGKGKTGCSANGENTYSATPLNTRNVKLTGVLQPSLAPTPTEQRARNEIFVIYADGNYFNSIDNTVSTYNQNFFLPVVGATPATVHNLQASYPSNIVSMYLTNRYETDDPPSGVRAAGWSAPEAASITFSNTTPNRVLTSIHDVAINKDLTLIIKNSSDAGLANDDTLFTNKIMVGTGTPVTNNFFTVSRVFSNRTQYSNKTDLQDLGNGKIVLKNITPNNPPYIFVNLRPTEALLPYAENATVKFSIKHRNLPDGYTFLDESVKMAHDPNFMEVLSTCQKNDFEKYVYYHIEFENTGALPGEKMKVEFHLQDYFNKKCIKEAQFFVGGVPVEGKIHRWHRRVTFVFDNNLTIKTCEMDPEHCSGYVEFCIRISAEKDLEDLNTILELEKATVIFNHAPFPIEMFVQEEVNDPNDPDADSRRAPPNPTCTCTCNK